MLLSKDSKMFVMFKKECKAPSKLLHKKPSILLLLLDQMQEFKKEIFTMIVQEAVGVSRVVTLLGKFLKQRKRLCLKPGEVAELVLDIVVIVVIAIWHLVDQMEDFMLERLSV
jgi:hypothetical protein